MLSTKTKYSIHPELKTKKHWHGECRLPVQKSLDLIFFLFETMSRILKHGTVMSSSVHLSFEEHTSK